MDIQYNGKRQVPVPFAHLFVPPNDDPMVPPQLVLDHLSHPVLDMGRLGIADGGRLGEVAILLAILQHLQLKRKKPCHGIMLDLAMCPCNYPRVEQFKSKE